jgi:hypothetical protein
MLPSQEYYEWYVRRAPPMGTIVTQMKKDIEQYNQCKQGLSYEQIGNSHYGQAYIFESITSQSATGNLEYSDSVMCTRSFKDKRFYCKAESRPHWTFSKFNTVKLMGVTSSEDISIASQDPIVMKARDRMTLIVTTRTAVEFELLKMEMDSFAFPKSTTY